MTDDAAGPDGPALSEGLGPTVPKRGLVERLRDDAQGEDLGADGMGWSPDPALKREAADELERLRTENAALKREAHTWWQFAVSAPQDERKRCVALCKAQADRWADDRARYAAIECAKAIEAQVPT